MVSISDDGRQVHRKRFGTKLAPQAKVMPQTADAYVGVCKNALSILQAFLEPGIRINENVIVTRNQRGSWSRRDWRSVFARLRIRAWGLSLFLDPILLSGLPDEIAPPSRK
jgi:hypothetical protein